MSMKSEIDMCVRFDKDSVDNIRFRPTGVLRQSYNNDCDDNIENKAILCVEKRMFGESEDEKPKGHPDHQANDGLNWFAGSNDLDALTQPTEHASKDLIIKASKQICGINVDFSINDNKSPQDEPQRLVSAEDAGIRIVASTEINGVEVLGELGTASDSTAASASGYTQANGFKAGVGVKTGQNFFGIKNLMDAEQSSGTNSGTKLLVGGKLSQFSSDGSGVGNMDVNMELGPHLLSSDYKIWGNIESDKNADGYVNYLKLFIDTTKDAHTGSDDDCGSVTGICTEPGTICATIGMARYNENGKKQDYVEVQSNITRKTNATASKNDFSLCIGQTLEIC